MRIATRPAFVTKSDIVTRFLADACVATSAGSLRRGAALTSRPVTYSMMTTGSRGDTTVSPQGATERVTVR